MKTFKGSRFVFAIIAQGETAKIFDVMFGSDGSLYVNFPYFKSSIGIASHVTFPAGEMHLADLSYFEGGKVTSHLVKYAHHLNGRTHFSQTGKVQSVVRKQSVPLLMATGHLFTVKAQGLSEYDNIDPKKDIGPPTQKRTVLKFDFSKLDPQGEAYKFLGTWDLKSEIQERIVGHVEGPIVMARNPEGHIRWGFLISPPEDSPSAGFLLYVSCESIPFEVETGEPTLSFMGGFDSPSVINDPNLDTQFLFLSYPAENYDELRSRLGTIDLDLSSN